MKFSSGVTKRKSRGKQEYVAWLAYYDVDGRRRWKYRSAPSPSKAKEFVRDLEKQFIEGGEMAIQSDAMTFAELADHCQTEKYCKAVFDAEGRKVSGVSDTSVYEAHLKHFKAFFGKMRLRDIKVANLRSYRNHRLRTKTKLGTTVNVSTVNREMNTLKAMLSEARINDWILVNPFSKARGGELIRTRDEKKREVTLSYDQELRLLASCEGERLERSAASESIANCGA